MSLGINKHHPNRKMETHEVLDICYWWELTFLARKKRKKDLTLFYILHGRSSMFIKLNDCGREDFGAVA